MKVNYVITTPDRDSRTIKIETREELEETLASIEEGCHIFSRCDEVQVYELTNLKTYKRTTKTVEVTEKVEMIKYIEVKE